ncbi:hypothetical protein J6590_059515 [Homalodisca vitripennis]|nr:hypothetical protein J6590_059515 [Homalodisca vitripennis]
MMPSQFSAVNPEEVFMDVSLPGGPGDLGAGPQLARKTRLNSRHYKYTFGGGGGGDVEKYAIACRFSRRLPLDHTPASLQVTQFTDEAGRGFE